MSDIVDSSRKIEDIYLKAAISIARKPVSIIKPKGLCYNCLEPLDNKDKLFCDTDCSDDWNKRINKAS